MLRIQTVMLKLTATTSQTFCPIAVFQSTVMVCHWYLVYNIANTLLVIPQSRLPYQFLLTLFSTLISISCCTRLRRVVDLWYSLFSCWFSTPDLLQSRSEVWDINIQYTSISTGIILSVLSQWTQYGSHSCVTQYNTRKQFYWPQYSKVR